MSSEALPAISDWFVPRPAAILQELPQEFRWEFTRRHPYYLQYWTFARRDFQSAGNFDELLQKWAPGILRLIGVMGEPPAPSLEYEALNANDFLVGWEDGAVTPPTLKGLLAILVQLLPSEARAEAGQLLLKFTTGEEAQPHALIHAL
ncbi:MAG: hypothetical protein N2C14_20415, partial [Planctomycetales bacterium]